MTTPTRPRLAQLAADVRDFDLNIEKVLEGWSVSHAVREMIANALDERVLTNSGPVEITRVRRGTWCIRDNGRGLRHTHFTQNECPEKVRREREVIGRFGVGLKDALAVLDRRKVEISLRSRHGDITLVHQPKAGFPDVTTLHARVQTPSDTQMVGTEILLEGVTDSDIETAKSFFLEFSGEQVLETTRIGQILARPSGHPARIYVKGLVVSEEPEFAFSYNVTALTQAMRRALNRERTNVGRSAYGDRVKAMLLAAASPAVAEVLVQDLAKLSAGTAHEEVRTWTDVGVRACQILNAAKPVVFVTAEQLVHDKEMVDRAIEDGREVITIPNSVAAKLPTVVDISGKPLQSLERFASDWSASVEFCFIDEDDLTSAERAIFSRWREIADLDGGVPRIVRAVLVSETMRPSVTEGMHPAGLWEPVQGRVIIHRPELRSLGAFAGTLLHELTHARSGHEDVSRDFELALTSTIGRVSVTALKKRSADGTGSAVSPANKRLQPTKARRKSKTRRANRKRIRG